jgi:hypothetical protein
MIKTRKMRCAGHVARIGGEVECIYDFGGKAGREESTRKRDQWRAPVNTVMNLQVP